jgi:hypothetical protein
MSLDLVADIGRPPRVARRGLVVALVASFAVFARTSYPTITWWDSGNYSLAAATLGLTGPPGSLLLTLLGWLVTRLPLGLAPERVLNLLAGALASATVGLVYLIAVRLLRFAGAPDAPWPRRSHAAGAAATGALLGALAFGFSVTLWTHAIQLTPYVLTAVFTGLILLTLLAWWEDAPREESWRWLVLLGLLFGLDFSVHRTNLLLVPGAAAWILIRRPRTVVSGKAWIGGLVGLAAGLAAQLAVMPIAAHDPPMNFGDPSSWSRFYQYVSLEQYGGGFLVRFFPRHAPLWAGQVMDLVRAFGANFFTTTGPLGVAGLLPAVFGVIGLVALWDQHPRLGVAIAVSLVLHAAVTVLYFNIPAGFFRPFDRHYLPVFVSWGVLVAYGLGATLRAGWNLALASEWRVVVPLGLLLAVVPAAQLARNGHAVDGSKRYFARDLGANVLNGLPPNAIVFTNGDNDTWPLLYLQYVSGVRRDVQVVNLSLANAAWYRDMLVRHDSAFPLFLSAAERRGLSAGPWADTIIGIPVSGADVGLGAGASPPRAPAPAAARRGSPPGVAPLEDSIALAATPRSGGYVLPQDLFLLQLLRDNRWRRPICFTATVSDENMRWLERYRRLDGIFWRVIPRADPPVDPDVLRRNLLETYVFRGYADRDLPLGDESRQIATSYYPAFLALARAEEEAGALDRCRAVLDRMLTALPPERLLPDAAASRALVDSVAGACMPGGASPGVAR